MCGLAGYNVNKELAKKFLESEPERQKDVLRQAWLHNLHRGYDAAGYMGHNLNDQTDWFKYSGPAPDGLVDHVDKPGFVMNTMSVFAAHTRAATLGDAKENDNNHPVMWDNVFVTHNGHINNHDSLKTRLLTNKEKADFPKVDSAVIPLVLSEYVGTPIDLEGIVSACKEMWGAFSFHAIWGDFPGISVLVRGTGRPLVIAELPGSMVFYGSEPESVWAMINRFGIDPNKKFKWWELDTNKIIIVDNGRIVKWANFFKSTTNNNIPDETVKRWLPREKGRQRELVFHAKSKNDFLNQSTLRSLKGREKEGLLVYDRVNGFTDTKTTFPVQSEMNMAVQIAEADFVYEKDGFAHAFFGDVEIVLSSSRTIKDVFNHAAFPNSKRFEVEKTKTKSFENPSAPGSNLTWEEFHKRHTTDIKEAKIPTADSEYTYVRLAREDAKKKKQLPKATAPVKTGDKQQDGKELETISDLADPAYQYAEDLLNDKDEYCFDPPMTISWDTFFNDAVVHETHPLYFLHDTRCPEHEQNFTTHDDPEDCPIVLNAASYAMAATDSLEIFTHNDPSLTIKYHMSENACGTCVWEPSCGVKISNNFASWLVHTSEQCIHCSSWRNLKADPAWWSLLNVADTTIIMEGESSVYS